MTSHYIEFPALGWHFPLNDTLVNFSLFGHAFTIKWYGMMIAIGFLLAVLYALKNCNRFGLRPDPLIDATLVSTLVAFVGARLYYVFFCADVTEYLSDPISILYIWNGGLGIYGGIIAAFLCATIMCKIVKLPVFAAFDIASLGFLIGQTCGRWGNFFNQEAFGSNTTLPWGMTGDIIQSGINGTGYDTALPVHPTFLYESLWCALGFLLLHVWSKKAYRVKGQIFCGYLVWYGTGRFFIESLRTDSLMAGTMKTSQLVAVVAVLLGILLYVFLRRRQIALPKNLLETPATEEAEQKTNESEETVEEESTAEETEDKILPQEQEEESYGKNH